MELLQVGLVAARPVGRLVGYDGPQHVEDAVQAFLVNDVADADELGVVGRDADREIALRHLQHQVDLLDTLDGAGLDGLDQRSAMVGVDDGLANGERHR